MPLNIHYRILTQVDEPAVVKMLTEAYMPFEPLSKCLNLTRHEMRIYSTALTRVVLRHNASVGAFDQATDAICGITMNSIGTLELTDEEEEMYDQMSDKLQYLVRFEDYTEQIFLEKDLQSKFMHHEMLTVKESYSKHGIGTELVRRSIEIASNRGCSFTVGFATSYKGLLIDKKLGLESVMHKIDMLKYRDPVTKERIFVNAELPEHCVFVMRMELSIEKK
ncbi:uncharacterized protein LOC143460622 isoform X1 [Clavelina lepadiformis]|uniref:uncharacterized protein LOC143460622 isoform X1 n=1 Tax=Clavelina lepadiformis TaxID=159417 RepID=UPI00404354B1